MKPDQVIFPQKRWRLIEVIHTSKGGHWSLARGDWGNNEGKWEKDVLAIRWNGAEGERGFPGVGKYPLWFILPAELYEAIRSVVLQEQLESKITQMVNAANQGGTRRILPGDVSRIQVAVSSFVEKSCHPLPYGLPASTLEDLPNHLKTAISSISSALLVPDDLMKQICDQLAEWINANYG